MGGKRITEINFLHCIDSRAVKRITGNKFAALQRCLSFKSKVFQLLKKRQTSLDSAYRQVRELFRYPGRAAAFFYGKLFRQFVDVFQIGYSLVRQQLVYDEKSTVRPNRSESEICSSKTSLMCTFSREESVSLTMWRRLEVTAVIILGALFSMLPSRASLKTAKSSSSSFRDKSSMKIMN